MTKEELRARRKVYADRYKAKKILADPDYYNRKARQYREKNREKMREYMRAYMRKYWEDEQNYKKQCEYSFNWYRQNKEKGRVQAEE